jgi:hypothetical protein
MIKKNWLAILCICASAIFIFFPYEIFEGVYGKYEIKLNRYESLANFLTYPLSLISVVLIYVTYQSQRKETKNAEITLKQQQFETTLFNLLQLKSNKLNELTIGNATGVSALNILLTNFYEEFKLEHKKTSLSQKAEFGTGIAYNAIDEKSRKEEFEFTTNMFKKFLEDYINNITPLIFIFNLLKEHIRTSSFFSENDFYLSLVNSQLTKPEQLFILYNYMSICNNLEDYDEIKKQIINKFKLDITILPDECFSHKHYHYFVQDINAKVKASSNWHK